MKLIQNLINQLLREKEPHEIFPELLEWEIGDFVYETLSFDEHLTCYNHKGSKYLGSDGTHIYLETFPNHSNPNALVKLTAFEIAKQINNRERLNNSLRERRKKKQKELLSLQLSGNLYQEFLKVHEERFKEEYEVFKEENKKVLELI